MTKRIDVPLIIIGNWHKFGKLISGYIDSDTEHRYYTKEQVYKNNENLKNYKLSKTIETLKTIKLRKLHMLIMLK